MSKPAAVSVILVNHNTAALTGRCVDSLHAQYVARGDGRVGVEVLVVDNASRPAERVPLAGLDARVLYNTDNRGYGAALNQALPHAGSELIVFSNADTYYYPGALQALVDGLATLPRAGALGPRFWWDLERGFLLPPSDPVTVAGYAGQAVWSAWPASRRRWQRRALRYWRARQPRPQAMLSGACIATRRQVLDACGGFDEGFQLYYEDTDWCRRLRKRGYRLYYTPAAEVAHLYNQSGRQDVLSAQQTFAASAHYYLRKHYGTALTKLLTRLNTAGHALMSTSAPPAVDLGVLDSPPRFAATERGTGCYLLLLSPNPSGIPAIGRLQPSPDVALSPAVWAQLGDGTFFSRLFALPRLQPLGSWRWTKAGRRPPESQHRA